MRGTGSAARPPSPAETNLHLQAGEDLKYIIGDQEKNQSASRVSECGKSDGTMHGDNTEDGLGLALTDEIATSCAPKVVQFIHRGSFTPGFILTGVHIGYGQRSGNSALTEVSNQPERDWLSSKSESFHSAFSSTPHLKPGI
jgi:hypothetical protein